MSTMKKTILFLIMLLFSGLNVLMAQFVKVNPIPTYNYPLTQQYAGFQENGTGEDPREKRDMDVEVTTSSDNITDIFATVWIVKKNGTEVLGPYTVFCNDILSVELPKGKWGVIINCNWAVNVSVWIEKVHPRTFNEFLDENKNFGFLPTDFLTI
jgi:hypothetical protein